MPATVTFKKASRFTQRGKVRLDNENPRIRLAFEFALGAAKCIEDGEYGHAKGELLAALSFLPETEE